MNEDKPKIIKCIIIGNDNKSRLLEFNDNYDEYIPLKNDTYFQPLIKEKYIYHTQPKKITKNILQPKK